MIKQAIDTDIKQAMLAGDKQLVSALRTIKSVILDAEIKEGVRDTGLEDQKVIALLQKEAKKRGETAELYKNAGDESRAKQELYEKGVLGKYLPEQLDEAVIIKMVDDAIDQIGDQGPQAMGQIIGIVKAKGGAAVDGAVVARIVKERL